MKKSTLLSAITLLSVIFLSFTYFNPSKSNPESGHSLLIRPGEMQPGEDNLYLTPDTLQPPSGYAGLALKNSSLYYYAGSTLTPIDSLQNKMDTAYIRGIYDTAAKRPHGTNYVTVLQIKYGFRTNKVVLYFKGLCLTRDTYNGTSKQGSYSDHNKFDSNYYTCSPTGFVRAPYKNQFQVDSASYASTMQIRHHVGGSVNAFYPVNTTDSADVNSIIFSFQEVYLLVNANHYSHYVKFSNIGRPTPIDGKSFIQHSIMMGPSDLPPAKTSTAQGSGVYYNVYADFGQLCPPACGELTFTLQ